MNDLREYRYPFSQSVRYECSRGRRILAFGEGKTLGMSSHEICFTTQHDLKSGDGVHLTVSWPVLLNNACRIQLEIMGKLIHAEPGKAIARITHHVFRRVVL